MGQLTFQATLGGAINLAGPNIATTTTFTLPSADGTNGQALITNGSGTLSFGSPSAATATVLGTVYGKQTSGGGTPFLTALGYNSSGTTTGIGVVAIGTDALYANSSGGANTAVGYGALYATTTTGNATAVGYQAGANRTTGTNFTAFGYQAGINVTTGAYCVAIGGNALGAGVASAGDNNIAIGGVNALANNTSGSENVAIGRQAMLANTTGAGNVAIGGYQPMISNTTGGNNVAVGSTALYNNTTGSYNYAFGYQALYSTTTATSNCAFGYQALYASTANANTAMGHAALQSNTTGEFSVAVGHLAGQNCTTNGYSVFIGKSAGATCTTGISNTIIGTYAASSVLTTGSRNTYVGYGLSPSGAAVVDEIIFQSGSGGTGKGSYTGFINPGTGGVYQGNNSATWSVASDRRLKKSIVDNNIGLEKITQIQVRNFEYRLPEEVTELPQNQAIEKVGVQLGVIAQELQAVLPDCIKTESTGVMTVNSDNLTWYMINAIKELKAEFDLYKSTHP